MTFRLKSAIEEMRCSGQGCVDCPYRISEDKSFACENDEGWKALYIAIDFWRLLKEKEKAEVLFNWVGKMMEARYSEVLKIEEETGEELENPYLTIPEIKNILALIEGLKEALYVITDKHWHVKPEYVNYVIKNAPSDLITIWKGSDSHPIYSLWNSLALVLGVEFSLKGALKLEREVEYG